MSADARVPIALFARAPLPGRVKTRLIPALGAQGAASLYRAFVHDTVAKVAAIEALDPIVWAASADDALELTRELGAISLDRDALRTQPDADLGERMRAALEEGVLRAGRALVIGTDAPTLPASILRAAVAALERADLVLGPACDGGFYLIGARERVPRLGPGVRWSSRHALADTLEQAGAADVALLPPWYDVDTPDDLRLLRAHLAVRPAAAPATARACGSALASFDHDDNLQ